MISAQNLDGSTPQKSNKPTLEGMEAFLRHCLMRAPTEGEVEAGRRILERLPRNQHSKFESLMLTSGRQELELYEWLLGKNTPQAARIVANEYIDRFGETEGTIKRVIQALIPKGRANSWEDLDLNITLFCKQFNVVNCFDKYRHLIFFDNIRFLLNELPQRKDYKPDKEKYYFVTCDFCWRSVPRISTCKNRPLCDVHNVDSTNREYRRRKRLAVRAYEIWNVILNSVPGLKWVRNNTNIDPQEFYLNMCRDKNGYLPYLAEYLESLCLPLTSPKDIIMALEHGIYLNKMSPVIHQAWEAHVEFLAENLFWMYHRTLFVAEAWLQADAECKPRGRGKAYRDSYI